MRTGPEQAEDPDKADEREKNGVPVLERMMEIFAALETRSADDSIRGLSARLGIPRSTVYRILNSLAGHCMVQRRGDGTFALGPRLITLGERARTGAGFDLIALAMPVLRQLAGASGQAAKLSVVQGSEALVLAAVPGTAEYALNPATGKAFPLHAGAASKLLLAHLPQAVIDQLLGAPLPRHTDATVTEPQRLAAELARIRSEGWASDRGEHGISVGAVAAPVRGTDGQVIAALSIPFLNLEQDDRARDRFRDLVIRAAVDLSALIAAPGAAQ